MRKVAVFSDIHGNYQALKSILDDIKKENFNDIICLGDLVAIGPDSILCLDAIINSNVKLLLGNHELYQIKGCDIDNLSLEIKEHESFINSMFTDKHKEYLNNCPLSYEFLDSGHLFSFSHFLIKNSDDAYPFYPIEMIKNNSTDNILINYPSDYLFFGHIHDNFDAHIDTRFFSCVGSSGCVSGNTTYYTVIEINNNLINITRKYVTYDRKLFEKSFKSKEYPARKEVASFFGIELN